MPSTPKLIAFAGSLRKDSFNKKLARAAGAFARDAGAEVIDIDLADYPLPVFDEDLEKQGTPQAVLDLKKHFIAADGFIIASPEYNSSVTAALKNTIDWLSRPGQDEPMLAAFAGKTATIMAASPGALGGLRGLVHLRAILSNIQVTVLPGQHAMGKAHEAFDAEGRLADDGAAKRVQGIVQQMVDVTAKLKD